MTDLKDTLSVQADWMAGAVIAVLYDLAPKGALSGRAVALPYCFSAAVIAVINLVTGTAFNIFAIGKHIACRDIDQLPRAFLCLAVRPIGVALFVIAALVAAPIMLVKGITVLEKLNQKENSNPSANLATA